jgi:cell division protein FtsW (lipid II flippase)
MGVTIGPGPPITDLPLPLLSMERHSLIFTGIASASALLAVSRSEPRNSL